MTSGEELLDIFYRKDASWYAAGGRLSLCVPVGGGECPSEVTGVLRDVRVSLAAGVLRRG